MVSILGWNFKPRHLPWKFGIKVMIESQSIDSYYHLGINSRNKPAANMHVKTISRVGLNSFLPCWELHVIFWIIWKYFIYLCMGSPQNFFLPLKFSIEKKLRNTALYKKNSTRVAKFWKCIFRVTIQKSLRTPALTCSFVP